MQALPSPAITAAPAVGACAVCWGAILAGSAVVAAISLLLFALVSGVDLATLSAASGRPSSASAVALIATQWVSACLGGYITGRLRTRWVGPHTHEVFFRDTAHGFITWCVATLILATGVVSVAAGLLGGSVHVGSPGAVRMPRTELSVDAAADTTLPSAAPVRSAASRTPALEVTPRSDLVLPEGPATTGVIELYSPGPAPLATAPARVVGNSNEAALPYYGARSPAIWQASDLERRDAARTSIITALSMLIGAFIASVSAAVGGRLRDLHP
jgi:hypothetical protein